MQQLVQQLLSEAQEVNVEAKGMSDEFIDSLDRVPKAKLSRDDECPICATAHLDDEYPLVVILRCGHKFDKECLAP